MAGASHGQRTVILPVGRAVLTSSSPQDPFVTFEHVTSKPVFRPSGPILEPSVEPPRTLAFSD